MADSSYSVKSECLSDCRLRLYTAKVLRLFADSLVDRCDCIFVCMCVYVHAFEYTSMTNTSQSFRMGNMHGNDVRSSRGATQHSIRRSIYGPWAYLACVFEELSWAELRLCDARCDGQSNHCNRTQLDCHIFFSFRFSFFRFFFWLLLVLPSFRHEAIVASLLDVLRTNYFNYQTDVLCFSGRLFSSRY